MPAYNKKHAQSGIKIRLPKIECFPNQFRNYEITIINHEFSSVCPKTGLPDFGAITIKYLPDQRCAELKSLKIYFLAYRNLGIFQENAVNKILMDFADNCKPIWASVTGEFSSRGGIKTVVEAKYTQSK